MDEAKSDGQKADVVLEYELDAAPEKVWRAISLPEFREQWLPEEDLADRQPISSEPGEEVRYKMKDSEPPFLESVVTFQVRPGADGGTILRIVHGLVDERLEPRPLEAANSNRPCLLLAA